MKIPCTESAIRREKLLLIHSHVHDIARTIVKACAYTDRALFHELLHKWIKGTLYSLCTIEYQVGH